MNISTEENISSITVKMEGISRTRLPIPKDSDGSRDSRKRSEVEIHRVPILQSESSSITRLSKPILTYPIQLLYLVDTVFPSPEIREKISSSNSGFTLKAGLYEYPFSIRIPINSNCENDPKIGGLLNRLSFEKGSFEYAKDASRHVRGTLPPSLSGIPDDEAWVRYFLKVTVNRPQFYRSNMRSVCPHAQTLSVITKRKKGPLTLHSATPSSSSPSNLPARWSSMKPTPGASTK